MIKKVRSRIAGPSYCVTEEQLAQYLKEDARQRFINNWMTKFENSPSENNENNTKSHSSRLW